jgi:hypothetical protein
VITSARAARWAYRRLARLHPNPPIDTNTFTSTTPVDECAHNCLINPRGSTRDDRDFAGNLHGNLY